MKTTHPMDNELQTTLPMEAILLVCLPLFAAVGCTDGDSTAPTTTVSIPRPTSDTTSTTAKSTRQTPKVPLEISTLPIETSTPAEATTLVEANDPPASESSNSANEMPKALRPPGTIHLPTDWEVSWFRKRLKTYNEATPNDQAVSEAQK